MSWKIYGTLHGVARTAQCNEMTIKSSPEKNIKCGEPAGQAEQSKLRQERARAKESIAAPWPEPIPHSQEALCTLPLSVQHRRKDPIPNNQICAVVRHALHHCNTSQSRCAVQGSRGRC